MIFIFVIIFSSDYDRYIYSLAECVPISKILGNKKNLGRSTMVLLKSYVGTIVDSVVICSLAIPIVNINLWTTYCTIHKTFYYYNFLPRAISLYTCTGFVFEYNVSVDGRAAAYRSCFFAFVVVSPLFFAQQPMPFYIYQQYRFIVFIIFK